MKKKRRQVHNHPEMTPQELARCRPASEIDPLGLPIPTHLVSNEEYFPPFLQTSHQKQVEARVLDAVDQVPKRLNISRRQFLATSAGLATSFLALNEVFRDYAHGEALFRMAKDSGFDHAAFLADGPPSDLFVFDDQCHPRPRQPREYAVCRDQSSCARPRRDCSAAELTVRLEPVEPQ